MAIVWQTYICPGCKSEFEQCPELYKEYRKKAKRVFCTPECKQNCSQAPQSQQRSMSDWAHNGKSTEKRRQRVEHERRELQARLTSRRPSCYG